MLAAAGGFAAIVVLRAAGFLDGFWVLALFLLLLLAIPLAKTLSRRILLIFPVLLGAVPLLWWLPWPAWFPDRGTLILAGAAGAALGAATFYASSGRRIAALVPQIRWIDVVPLAAGAAAAAVQWNLLTVRRAEDALLLLVQRWDNASHFDMFHMIRTEGQVISLLPAGPDGSTWSFADYPQGFHSLLATLAELVHGTGIRPVGDELVSFAILGAVVIILASVLLAAGLCALPVFRRHTVLGVTSVALVSAGWILGPGAASYLHGFPNFYLAVALSASAVLLALSMDRVTLGLPLAAAASAAVGVAHNWIPLMVYVAAALFVALLPFRRSRWRSSASSKVTMGLISALGLASAAAAVSQVVSVEVDDVLTAATNFPEFNLGVVWILIVLGVVTYILLFGRYGSRIRRSPSGQRARWTVLVFGSGLAVAVVMSVLQIQQTGSLSYYAEKFILSFELIAMVLLAVTSIHVAEGAAGMSALPRISLRAPAKNRHRRLAASAAGVLVASQAFGSTIHVSTIGLEASAPAVKERILQDKLLETGPTESVLNLLAAKSYSGGAPTMYLTTTPSLIDPILAQQWYSALSRTYTDHSWELSWNMFALYKGNAGLADAVEGILDDDPTAELIVDPWNQPRLEGILDDLDSQMPPEIPS